MTLPRRTHKKTSGRIKAKVPREEETERLNKTFSQSKNLNVNHDPTSLPNSNKNGSEVITDHNSNAVTKLLSLAERIPEIEASQKKILATLEVLGKIILEQQPAAQNGTNAQVEMLQLLKDVISTNVDNGEQIKQLSVHRDDETRQRELRNSCDKMKRGIQLEWDRCLKERKRKYWNALKNRSKADLYSTWQKDAPDFIPLKYRPKKIPGETSEYTERRISEARYRYANDTELMVHYSDSHANRVKEIDRHIADQIEAISKSDSERELLLGYWQADTARDEDTSRQVWDRHESFLRKKKHEDEVKMNIQLASKTWQETLQERLISNRRKASKSQLDVDSCVTMETTTEMNKIARAVQ